VAAADKTGLVGLSSVETDGLLVHAAVPEATARALADTLQKTYLLSRTTLKFAADEKPWPGKLTVYVLTDAVQFTNFVRRVEQRRPDKDQTYTLNLRGDFPYAVHSVGAGERVTDADLTTESAAVVGAAVLNRKAGAGADLPEWLELGFGRAVAARADGSPVDVWRGVATKDSPIVAASLAEYLAFGPDADKFPKLLAALKPSDDRPSPTVETAFADLEWRPEAVELGWKQWVAKLK
jgi:hypothetical protein